MVTFAAFGGIIIGYDTGTINGILQMADWRKTFGQPDPSRNGQFLVSTSLQSAVVSILSAGTLLGALGGAPTADAWGRRIGMMFSCLVLCLGVALQTGASDLATFIVGRFFAGLGVGLVSILVPLYQSECSPKQIRGAIVSCYSFTITLGLLLSSVINNTTKDRENHSSWRIPIAIQFIWAFVLFTGMLWLPETPRWLMRDDRAIAAAKSLARLRSLPPDHDEVQTELGDIAAALEREKRVGQGSYRDCLRITPNKISLRTFSAIAIQALQQLTGITFIFYYGTTFFANAGIGNPFLVTVIVNVVNLLTTVPGIWGADNLGRRPLLLGGAVVMCICAFLVSILGVTTSVHDLSPQRAVIALVCIYIAAFASTWGPIAWVVTGEIFPLNVRAKAMSLSVASHWLFNWAISFAAPYLANPGAGNADLGVKVFFVWGSTCALCVVFVYLFIPETKGLSLEQVDILYQQWSPVARTRRQQVSVTTLNISDETSECEKVEQSTEGEGKEKCCRDSV
ncbi:hypothetical protein ONZ51_g429 [Trametes cubensis]|uniref:Major facilitator superfamily (MFS) profile domain-containing protein n=1 Tax=Trametes cubensis TaxID=1111947 RepID=A0AAD7U4R2_9APHY|nr:hypothetical protein ONZ51_g429 [Trametes cubensis]